MGAVSSCCSMEGWWWWWMPALAITVLFLSSSPGIILGLGQQGSCDSSAFAVLLGLNASALPSVVGNGHAKLVAAAFSISIYPGWGTWEQTDGNKSIQ